MTKSIISELTIKNLKNRVFQSNSGSTKITGCVLFHKDLGYISLGHKDSKGVMIPFISSRFALKDILENNKINNSFVFVQECQYSL